MKSNTWFLLSFSENVQTTGKLNTLKFPLIDPQIMMHRPPYSKATVIQSKTDKLTYKLHTFNQI